MTQHEIYKFFQWLDKHLLLRNMKYHRLAKEAGITHTVFTKAKAGHLPKWDTCVAIAKVFDVDPVEVFRAASLLPDLPPEDAAFEQMRYEFYQLPPSSRQFAIRVVNEIGASDE